MYDVPAARAAQGRFWALIQHHLPDAPNLSVQADVWDTWHSPSLYLSQTCGLPFRAKLQRHVALMGAFDHRLDGCPPGHYRSAIVTRKGQRVDLSGDFTLAVNDPLSQSGWAAPWAEGITGTARLHTGSHAASAAAVCSGQADAAALDAVTWAMLQRDWDGACDLQVIHWTAPTPALPLITAATRDRAPLAQGVRAAIAALSPQDRQTLHIHDLVDVQAQTYLDQAIPPLPWR